MRRQMMPGSVAALISGTVQCAKLSKAWGAENITKKRKGLWRGHSPFPPPPPVILPVKQLLSSILVSSSRQRKCLSEFIIRKRERRGEWLRASSYLPLYWSSIKRVYSSRLLYSGWHTAWRMAFSSLQLPGVSVTGDSLELVSMRLYKEL